jgi:hypothetical protein
MFNFLIKLYWRVMFGAFTLFYKHDDLNFINAGYADLNEKEGIYLHN